MKEEKWSLKKKLIAAAIALGSFGLVVAVVAVVSASFGSSKVIVIPVQDVDYGASGNAYTTTEGTISNGASQTVRADGEKAIAKIMVKKGAKVKKGDIIAYYDTRQAKLDLDQRSVDMQSIQVSLNTAKSELALLKGAREVAVAEDDGMNDEAFTEDAEDEEEEEETDEIETDEPEPNHVERQTPARTTMVWMDSNGTTYSASELRMEINSKNDEIRTLTTDLEEAKAEYNAAKREVDNSAIRANMNGVVTAANKSVIRTADPVNSDEDEDDEDEGNEPEAQSEEAAEITDEDTEDESMSEETDVAVRISAFDGIFVKTYISEWAKPDKKVDDEIYVTSWMSGEVYTAKITDISDYVAENYSTEGGAGTAAVSYYPMTATIEADNTGLVEGDSVEVSLVKPQEGEDDGITAEDGIVVEEGLMSEDDTEIKKPEGSEEDEEEDKSPIHLYKAFVRDDGGKKYCFIEDENERLHKQYLKVEGQETDTYIVTGGISRYDYIAFPYGPNAKEGAKVEEGSIDMLYED